MKSRLDLETHTCVDRLELNFFFKLEQIRIFFRSKLPETDHFQVRMRFKINSCHVGAQCFPDSDFTWAGRPGILTDS